MSATPRTHDVVVVGAGIAGLSAAWEIRERDILVLEAADRVGGRIKSEPRDGYWLNFGAHVFSGPDSAVGRLITAAGVDARPVPGRLAALALNGRILASGAVETYPFRLPVSTAARISFITAGLKLRRAVAEYHRLSETRPGETVKDVRSRVLGYRDDRTFGSFLGKSNPKSRTRFAPPSTDRRRSRTIFRQGAAWGSSPSSGARERGYRGTSSAARASCPRRSRGSWPGAW